MAVSGVREPQRIAEWAIDATHRVRISGFEPSVVQMDVTSPTTGAKVTIDVMRIYLKEFDGEAGYWTWNMASKQGMVVLNEILSRPNYRELLLEVTRQGAPPKTRWAIRIVT